MLAVDAIAAILTTRVVGKPLAWEQRVDSTNDRLKQLALAGATSGAVLGAEYQLSGKGRFNRSWISTEGENILVSVLLRPTMPLQQFPLFNFLASLAVAETLATYPGVEPVLRWPNDVYLNGKKICGILSESLPGGAGIVIGIGLNVNQTQFPPDIPFASSLAIETGRTLDRGRLLHVLLTVLDDRYHAVCEGSWDGLMEEWRARWDSIGKQLVIRNGDCVTTGVGVALERDGALRLSDEHGTESLVYAGDVMILDSAQQ